MKDKVKDFIEKSLGDRVVCLLFYGSQAFGGMSSNNTDYDFLLILDEPVLTDFEVIRNYINKDNLIDITIQYKSRIMTRGMGFFQQGNHGVFFLKYLAQAQCLIGQNIFLENKHLVSSNMETSSLLFQCEEYFFRLQLIYLKSEKSYWIDHARKYLCRIMIDMLLIAKDFAYEDVSRISREDFINIKVASGACFSDKTIDLSKYILKSNSELTKKVLLLYNSLYDDYLRQCVYFRAIV